MQVIVKRTSAEPHVCAATNTLPETAEPTSHLPGVSGLHAADSGLKTDLSPVKQPVVVQQTTHIAGEQEMDAATSAMIDKQESAGPFSRPSSVATVVSRIEFPAIEAGMATSGSMTLAELESIALAGNPTLRQLAATTQKAAGYRTQVGLLPNPVVGYQAMQLADEGTDQHTAFIEQEFVTGGKLELNRRVLNQAVCAQNWELEAQRYRILTDIRLKFYEALATQQRIRLITEFEEVTQKGFELAELRKKAKEGSEVESLQAKIQMNEVKLSRKQAEVALVGTWRELAALTGTPALPIVTLQGDLNEVGETINWEETRAMVLAESPEYHAAQTRVQQSAILLERHGVQAIPNITVQMAAGVDNGTNSGMLNLQVGAPIPVFNKNQGNIAAARAEYCRSLMEVQRIENSIQSRLAIVSREFDAALAAVRMYADEILPSARKTLELSESAYKAGEFSFVEILLVRRTFVESNLQYLAAQVALAQAKTKATGFVLTGGLDPTVDQSGDDGLRGLTFSQQ